MDKPPSDFNDIAALCGPEAVADIIQRAESPSAEHKTMTPGNAALGDFEAAVERLAALKPHEYDRARKDEAKGLGVQLKTLDDAVTGARARLSGGSSASLFPDVEVWADPVEGAALLDEISETVWRFIACDRTIAEIVALWSAFTWLIDRFTIAPMLMITAPEKGCGKTTLLNLIAALVFRPLPASNISTAAIFRVIEEYGPTLLLDETDTFLKESEEMRGVINSGHTRASAFVVRLVGEGHTPKKFSTFGAKVLCGIGGLNGTLESRSLIMEMRRRLPGERIERLHHAERGLFERLASQMARFAGDAGDAIERLRPDLPDALGDRARDNAEPLLAIADYAGGGWPERARAAILKIAGAAAEADSHRDTLLADIQAVFTATGRDRLSTAELLESLAGDDTKPWAAYNRGKPMIARQLAKRLEAYKIRPHTIRIGESTPKGFLLTDFSDTFARYLSSSPGAPLLSATPPQPAEKLDLLDNLSATGETGVADEKIPNQLKTNDCGGVADKNPLTGEKEGFGGAESEVESDL